MLTCTSLEVTNQCTASGSQPSQPSETAPCQPDCLSGRASKILDITEGNIKKSETLYTCRACQELLHLLLNAYDALTHTYHVHNEV